MSRGLGESPYRTWNFTEESDGGLSLSLSLSSHDTLGFFYLRVNDRGNVARRVSEIPTRLPSDNQLPRRESTTGCVLISVEMSDLTATKVSAGLCVKSSRGVRGGYATSRESGGSGFFTLKEGKCTRRYSRKPKSGIVHSAYQRLSVTPPPLLPSSPSNQLWALCDDHLPGAAGYRDSTRRRASQKRA